MSARRPRRAAAALAAAALALGLAGAAAAASLAAGPMPGYPAMRAALIWLQADGPATAEIVFWPRGAPAARRRSAPAALVAGEDFAAKIPITALEPGTRYAYEVWLDGRRVAGPEGLGFHTPALWQWRRDPPAYRIALGSCAYINEAAYDRPGPAYGSNFGIFDRIAAEAPAMMLWLGDNLYLREPDFDSPYGLAYRYRHARGFAPLQRLLRSTHHVAIWDDHDYGPNNANASYALKAHSLALFQRYWPNPAFGTPGLAGIHTTVSYADSELFLLDDRFHRDDDTLAPAPAKQLYGPEQLRWLRNALAASKARFKFIAGGSQFLSPGGSHEGWHHFPAERERFLAWLAEARISGVVFLSGDRHSSELLRLAREGDYPLYELTCSPLTAGARSREDAEANARRVEGSFVGRHNYCLLEMAGAAAERRLGISVHGAGGERLWQRAIPASALVPPGQ